MSEDHFARRRIIAAAPRQIFGLLTDPTRHAETEPTDWVRAAIDPEPLTEVGQVFGITMFHANAGGEYTMHNTVTALEPDAVVAWEPGQRNDAGELGKGGWTWRYDLAAVPGGTEVTLTYDWSNTPESLKQQIGLPPFGPEFLDQSLAALDRAVTG